MIVVFGGTGTLGTHVVDGLTSRGSHVRVASRTAVGSSNELVEMVIGDVRDASFVARSTNGARCVVSAITGFGPDRSTNPVNVDLEGNRNLIAASHAAGVEHFVLVSARGASRDHPIELFRMKYLAERELVSSGLSFTILRPSASAETWLQLLGAPLLERGRTRIMGRGDNPINFVSARDVAQVIVRAVTETESREAAVQIGGPDDLTLKQLVGTFSSVTGAAGKVSHVPLPILRLMSVLMKPANPAVAALIRAAVVMDTTDMTLGTSGSEPLISPTSVAEVARMMIDEPKSAVRPMA